MTITGKRYVESTVLGTSRSNVEAAEDSSYDSDFEPEDISKPSEVHPEVTRTTSETLAAEFSEYVTLEETVNQNNPGYTSRVEFALKLGYTEKLVQAALKKLGPNPGQNELLAELIKLGASSAKLASSPEESSSSDQTLALNEQVTNGIYSSLTTNRQLRPVVIDGSNVAMSHGNKQVFSCKGIKICVDWFKSRGHQEITVFVPKWRKESSRPDNPIVERDVLAELEKERMLVFTPSRLIGGKRMVCYDDRYILRLAAEVDGIVVSNDNYRDLIQESPEFRKVIEERILMYSFVNDRFMPPDDPLGRSGPSLEKFLKVAPQRLEPALTCPYGKKCTYGNKCKFFHPERGAHHKSVTDRLMEHAQLHLKARISSSLSLPVGSSSLSVNNKNISSHPSLSKTKSWAHATTNLTSFSNSITLKSKSVENVAADDPSNVSVSTSSLGWNISSAKKDSSMVHKKLQRQLTINPNYDPRIHQMQQVYEKQSLSNRQKLRDVKSYHGSNYNFQNGHDERSYQYPLSWDQYLSSSQYHLHHHQNLSRMSSEPLNSHQNYNCFPMKDNVSAIQAKDNERLAMSDPQLNLYLTNWHDNNHECNYQEKRRHLYYHLASLFPEEYVKAALSLNPKENDPHKICADILKMFEK